MIISDLNYLESAFEETANITGAFTAVSVGSSASAFGDTSFTFSRSRSLSLSSPYAGSAAIGYSQSVGIAYTPPSFR